MKLVPLIAACAALLSAPLAHAAEAGHVDAVKLGLARELVEASGGAKAAEEMLTQMYSSMDAIFAKAPPKQAKLFAAIQRDLRDETIRLILPLTDASVEVYARVLTEKELRDMLTFQVSESGQSISRKMPLLMSEVVKAQVPILQDLMPVLLRKAVDRACEEAACSAQDREQIVAVLSPMFGAKPS